MMFLRFQADGVGEVSINFDQVVKIKPGSDDTTCRIYFVDGDCMTLNHSYEDVISEILDYDEITVEGVATPLDPHALMGAR